MIATLMVLLFVGYPVAFILIGVTFCFAVVAVLDGLMTPSMLALFPLRIYGLLADSLIFPAVPPLVFMGVTLARSGLARDLFDAVGYLLRKVPGGLALAVLLIGIILAPSAGLLGTAVSVLALVALPALVARRHSPAVAAGAVAAGGTLGVILPPAIMLFFLADLLGTSIAATFTAILMPAALLVLLYGCYFVSAAIRGRNSTAGVERDPADAKPARLLGKILLPAALVSGVLACIIFGWATPSQSGSLGAAGAVLTTLIHRSFSWVRLRDNLIETGYVIAMVFLIIIAANAFSFVFRVLGGDDVVAGFLAALALNDWGKLLFILAVIFVLGFFIDWLEIVLITLPIFAPVIAALDFSSHVGEPIIMRVWLATTIAVVLQTSFLTPPFGFALFFLRAGAPPEVRLEDIYRGVAPIVAIQLVVVAAILALPSLATQLPRLVLS